MTPEQIALLGEIEQEFVALPDLAAWIRRLQDRVRNAPPDWKGYALLGTGDYCIDHTAGPPDPELGAELVISIATEADKAGNRQVGEERDQRPEKGQIQPEQMAIRIGFLSATALDALESQLRHLRRENFPESIAGVALPDPVQAERDRAAQICANLATIMESGAGDPEPGGRLRQAERMIRNGDKAATYGVTGRENTEENDRG